MLGGGGDALPAPGPGRRRWGRRRPRPLDPLHDSAVTCRRDDGIDVCTDPARFVGQKLMQVGDQRPGADRIPARAPRRERAAPVLRCGGRAVDVACSAMPSWVDGLPAPPLRPGDHASTPRVMPAAPDPAPAGETPAPHGRHARQVLVDLDVLITPADEDGLARAVHAAVARATGTAVLGPARWGGAVGGEDLVRQWDVEQGGAPLDGRRVRRLTMSVHPEAATDLLEEIAWAAIEAICPTARDEQHRLDAGEAPVPARPDRYPWSSATRTGGV